MPVKISYNATLFRVRCELTRAAVMASETPPPDLLARAKAKLEAVKAGGEIAFYVIYETRLAEAWKALRADVTEVDDRKIGFTLAAGSPALAGIRLDKPVIDKVIATLSIDAPKDQSATWRWEWFKLNVHKRLRDAGIKDTPNWAQLFAAFTRVKGGDKVQGLPLGSLAAASGAQGPQAQKIFSVIANKQRMEIGVVIRNAKELRKKENREAMLLLVNQAVRQLSVDGVAYRVLKQEFLGALGGALDGPEALGIELPLVLLAAIGQQQRESRASAAPITYPGAGKISFNVTPDKMEAAVVGFQKSYYDDPTFTVNLEWLGNELKRSHLNLPIPEDLQKLVGEAMARQDDINGMAVMRGEIGSGGKGPFLHPSFRDAAGRTKANFESDNLDIRELQQRTTVKAGQIVAEIRYEKPPVPGRNVYGDEVPPPPNDELIVRVGDGIQQREAGRFFATADGLPTLDHESISLAKQLIHAGDVNLRTGNIRFDGPAEIMGSIDAGAVVEVSGDLIVHGTIRGAQVSAMGTLTVKEGIVTGPHGKVYSRGDMAAEFIENSNITCGGSLTVTKALISSNVIAGGQIRVMQKGGVVAGGQVISKDSLYTFNLGFKNGAVTHLNVGVDWRIARSLEIRKGRLDRLSKKAQEDRQTLRELVQKSKAQLTARHKEMKEQLQDKLQRMRALIEKLEALVQKAQSSLTYSQTARIYCEEMLASNVQIQICGQAVAVVNDVFNVGVQPKRKRGSYLVPLEEMQAEERKAGGGGDDALASDAKKTTKKAG